MGSKKDFSKPLYSGSLCGINFFRRGSTPAWQKENVSFPMMNIEINATMKEHDRQKEMRKNQALNAGIETTNRSEWNSFKDKVTKIQDRLRGVSFALQAIPTGVAMSRRLRKLLKTSLPLLMN